MSEALGWPAWSGWVKTYSPVRDPGVALGVFHSLALYLFLRLYLWKLPLLYLPFLRLLLCLLSLCDSVLENIRMYSITPQYTSPYIFPGSKSPLDSFVDKIRLWYYQYEVTFSLYVMTPTEKIITNTIVLSIFALFLYAIVSFTPLFITQFISRSISSLFWVYVNDSGNQLVVRHTPVTWVNTTNMGWEEFGGYTM